MEKNLNTLEPVVYSRSVVLRRSRDELTIPVQASLEAPGKGTVNTSGMSSLPNSQENIHLPVISEPSSVSLESPVVYKNPTPSVPQENDLDLPIAVRKGTRTCTKHPIAKYITYDHLSETHKAFTTNLSKIVVPRNIQKALED